MQAVSKSARHSLLPIFRTTPLRLHEISTSRRILLDALLPQPFQRSLSSQACRARLNTLRPRWIASRKAPQRLRPRRFASSKASERELPDAQLSLSQRLKKLSREYGWSALGVYLALSVLDFPFCFLAVRLLGTDRIGHWEHVAVEAVWKVIEIPFPNMRNHEKPAAIPGDAADLEQQHAGADWGVDEAQKANTGDGASLWTQLVLAYAIHKSFIFIRVPLTAGVTPKVVKTLRGWGWDIGKRTPKNTS